MVDRQIVQIGAIPQDTDILLTNKNMMVGMGYLMQALMGTSTVVDGLTVTPTTPASMNVTVATGSIYTLAQIDATAYGSLAADTTDQIVKQGIVVGNTTFSCPAPGTAGQSVVYLVQAIYQDTDAGSTVLPYYNASNPSVPYSGPGNAGTPNFTVRQGVCHLALKTGVAATTGTQVTPTADAGYTALYAVTVANGASTITSGNISLVSTAPYINAKVPNIPAYLQAGSGLYIADTSGTANTITATLFPPVTSLAAGSIIRVKVANTNTGATVMNVNGLGNVAVHTQTGAALPPGALQANGVYGFIHDGNFWQLQSPAARIALTANTTFYVATTGSDSNPGTSGSPWLTIQKAINVVMNNIDLAGFNVTISVADGTYTGAVLINGQFTGIGAGTGVTLQGNTTTPANCIISTTSANCISAQNGSSINVAGFKLQTTTTGHALFSEYFSRIAITGNMNFGAVPTGYNHCYCSDQGRIDLTQNYTISGGASNHYNASSCSEIVLFGGVTVTLTGTPAFATAFANAGNVSLINALAGTFSGSATGARYSAMANSVIQTAGGGASFFPGNSVGSTATGGQYI